MFRLSFSFALSFTHNSSRRTTTTATYPSPMSPSKKATLKTLYSDHKADVDPFGDVADDGRRADAIVSFDSGRFYDVGSRKYLPFNGYDLSVSRFSTEFQILTGFLFGIW